MTEDAVLDTPLATESVPAEPEPAEPEATEPESDEHELVDADADAGIEATASAAGAVESGLQDDPAEPVLDAAPVSAKRWYIVKVTSNREESIKAAIERKVKIEGLEEFFGQVYIPVERVVEVRKVKETKNGEKITKEKRVTKERKKYPGYLMAEVEFNDQILYLFRETSGVGDFVGSAPGKPPAPMNDIDIQRMLGEALPPGDGKKAKPGKTVVKLDFEKGDKVKIRDGAFAGMEGDVKDISTPKDASETPKITVVVTIFGRPVEMEFDHWQVDKN